MPGKVSTFFFLKRISPVTPWLGLHALIAENPGSDPDWRTETPETAHGQKIKKRSFIFHQLHLRNFDVAEYIHRGQLVGHCLD